MARRSLSRRGYLKLLGVASIGVLADLGTALLPDVTRRADASVVESTAT